MAALLQPLSQFGSGIVAAFETSATALADLSAAAMPSVDVTTTQLLNLGGALQLYLMNYSYLPALFRSNISEPLRAILDDEDTFDTYFVLLRSFCVILILTSAFGHALFRYCRLRSNYETYEAYCNSLLLPFVIINLLHTNIPLQSDRFFFRYATSAILLPLWACGIFIFMVFYAMATIGNFIARCVSSRTPVLKMMDPESNVSLQERCRYCVDQEDTHKEQWETVCRKSDENEKKEKELNDLAARLERQRAEMERERDQLAFTLAEAAKDQARLDASLKSIESRENAVIATSRRLQLWQEGLDKEKAKMAKEKEIRAKEEAESAQARETLKKLLAKIEADSALQAAKQKELRRMLTAIAVSKPPTIPRPALSPSSPSRNNTRPTVPSRPSSVVTRTNSLRRMVSTPVPIFAGSE